MSVEGLYYKGTVVSFSFDTHGVRRPYDYMLVSNTKDDECLFQLVCISGYYQGNMSGYIRKDNSAEVGNEPAVTHDHLVRSVVWNFGESVQVTDIQGPPLPQKLRRRMLSPTELCFYGTTISLTGSVYGAGQVQEFILTPYHGDREHHFQLVCIAGSRAGDVIGLIRTDSHKKARNATAVTRSHLVKELVRNLGPSVRTIRIQESYAVPMWKRLLRWIRH